MKLRQFNKKEPDVNLTPLIDVVFLLLIFFMVSTSFTRESEIAIELPEASAQKTESDNIPVEIAIDAQGRYFLDKKMLVNQKIETLIKGLRGAIAGKENPALIISADAKTPHQAVITAMDAARQVNILHLSIATKDSGNKN